MKEAQIIAGLCALFVTIPVWFWLLYQILVRVQATELMWFLFWAYIPVQVFVTVVTRIADAKKD